MPINVSQAIDLETGERIQITRRLAGYYNSSGIWIEGSETVIKAIASVQTPKPGELDFDTGSEREVDRKVFYIKQKLGVITNDMDQASSDLLVWHNQTFKIVKIGEWDAYGFTKAYAYRIA